MPNLVRDEQIQVLFFACSSALFYILPSFKHCMAYNNIH